MENSFNDKSTNQNKIELQDFPHILNQIKLQTSVEPLGLESYR